MENTKMTWKRLQIASHLMRCEHASVEGLEERPWFMISSHPRPTAPTATTPFCNDGSWSVERLYAPGEELVRQGLSFNMSDDGRTVPIFSGHEGWDALAFFFKTETAEIRYAFERQEGDDSSPLRVAERIEALVERKNGGPTDSHTSPYPQHAYRNAFSR